MIKLHSISDARRSFIEASSAKAEAALAAAGATFSSEVVDRTLAEARDTCRLAAISAVTGVAAIGCATLTIAQPAIGTVETAWQAAKAAWRA